MGNKKSLLLLVALILLNACKNTQTQKANTSSDVLFTVDGENVYPDEFIYAFEKSKRNKADNESEEEYLDLYINFKLKVKEAKAKGLDTTQAYQTELNGYLEEIKKPYLTAEKVNEKLIKEAYERLQQEINASHILIMVDENASPEDTLKAFNKIKEARNKAVSGENFEALARQYSEDPSVQRNNGQLGWFTAFQMVYPFENAAFKTNVGEISPIIKTQFGYHIIKVNDSRATLGRIKIAHIMKRFPPQATAEDSLETKNEIYNVYERLKEGENWFILATKESEDLSTKDTGGELPWFGAGNLPKELETAAFDLEQKGEISKPVMSPYGWHILKLEDKRGVGSLNSMKESLSRRIKRDQRSELKEDEVIRKLKTENDFQKNEKVYHLLKTKPTLSKEQFKKKELEQPLFSISSQKYSVEDFLIGFDKEKELDRQLENYEKAKLLEYEDENLETKYPEYRLLRQEYKEGLLLFEIMNREVWSKVGGDSTVLKEFYNKNKANYISEEKLRLAKIIFSDTSSINQYRNPIKEKYFPLSPRIEFNESTELSSIINLDSGRNHKLLITVSLPENLNKSDSVKLFKALNESFNEKDIQKLTDSNENKIYLQLFSESNELLALNNKAIEEAYEEIVPISECKKWLGKEKTDYFTDMTKNGMIELNYVLDKYLPRQKTFSEAKAELIEDYQKKLESDWVNQLKKKYEVNVNENILNKIKAKIEE
ncbi:peptidylprolyl isomerase [Marivirga arenosa]|uniref:Peptidylprolyl isomerase n=1 Tax=Marivirga arenosa TaxID=3059076 RepID=A0AA51N5D3_9BACT|nr:peptidylprolyl isomerase [Marivirga sp. ABR2-2]WMN05935.1 peptidylprolyl isomerase [Marivirga sp. ABR2-2]